MLVYQYIFSPVYPRFGTWPAWIKLFSYVIGIFASFYWILPVRDKIGRVVSLALFLLHFYFLAIRTSPWYFPPMAMMGLLVLVNGLFTLSNREQRRYTYHRTLVVGLLSAALAGMVYIFIMTAFEMRIQQKEVEDGNRKQVGLWLKGHIQKGETVYSESLGYIGYFSEARMLDYPGLVSPRVVTLLDEIPFMNFYTLILELQPQWVVLRPSEAQVVSGWDFFKEYYECVRTFSVIDNLARYAFIPGGVYVSYDAAYLIFKRKPAA